MGVSCIHLAAAFASLMFILFLSYGETTGGGVPSDAVTAHQEGYGAKKPEGEEKEDVESPELAATELDGVAILAKDLRTSGIAVVCNDMIYQTTFEIDTLIVNVRDEC